MEIIDPTYELSNIRHISRGATVLHYLLGRVIFYDNATGSHEEMYCDRVKFCLKLA